LSIGVRGVLKPFAVIVVGFPGGSDSKESACRAGDLGSNLILAWRIPWTGAW